MKLERAALLRACETVKPALAAKEVHEEMVHIWSDGRSLTAYNDTSLGIQVPFESDVRGGMRGAVLLGVLANSRAKEVEIAATGTEAELRAGKTRLRLALLAEDRGLWQFPKASKGKGVGLSPGFLRALEQVLISCGKGTGAPEQLGVTLSGEGGRVHMIGTDGETISWKTAKRPEGWVDDRVILPTPFVKQLVRLGDDATTLSLSKDGVQATTGAGVRLFACVVDSPKPIALAKIATDNLAAADPVPLPARLRLALERASVVLNGTEGFVDVSVSGDRLSIHARTSFGEISDAIALEREVPKVSCRVNPDLIKRALPLCDRIGFSERSVVMTGERFVYLTAAAAGASTNK